jgi:hypothetical protein
MFLTECGISYYFLYMIIRPLAFSVDPYGDPRRVGAPNLENAILNDGDLFMVTTFIFPLLRSGLLSKPEEPGYLSRYSDWTTDWATGYRFPAEATDFPFLYSFHTGFRDHPVSHPMGTGDSFPGSSSGVKLTTYLHLLPRSK